MISRIVPFAVASAFACCEVARAATPLVMEDTDTIGPKRIRIGLAVQYLFKEYQPLELGNLNGGRGMQTPVFKHKFNAAQLDVGFGLGGDAEIQFLGSGLALMVPGSGSSEKLKLGPDDLLVGFKWRFFSRRRPGLDDVGGADVGPERDGGALAPNVSAAFYARTKLPNASETKLLGTNNTDFEFGFMGDYGTRSPFVVHAALGMNIVGDPRRANWQDDLITYRLAASIRDGKRLGMPWLPSITAFGFQGFAGYYKRHDRKQRVFVQVGQHLPRWPGNSLEVVLTRQVFGDKADRFELFNQTENFGIALRGARVF